MTDTVMVATRHGPMVALAGDAYITRSLQLYGEYGHDEADLFQQIVKPGMAVVEAGANIGAHSVMLARACAPGPLFAFEPQQRVFQLLCANLVMNGVTNAIAFSDAAGARAGMAVMPNLDYGSSYNFGSVSIKMMDVSAGLDWSAGQPTRVVAIDDLALPACGFLKIDVEGFEAAVLEGARQTIARLRPMLYVENDRASQQAALIALIDSLGYTQYWHVAPLFSRDNFNGAKDDVFNGSVSLNMFCTPNESELSITGFERIDPNNWRSPVGPIPG
ncbi:MAG TPA: FkbM family methyltransferase [Caulobacteraceae bacterium]|nr:FkbM family methyltransferase [Caulobacteraceae bacterium]